MIDIDTSWWALVTLLVVAPIAEEVVFRGLLLDYWLRRKWPFYIGNLVVSLLFSSLHLVWRDLPTAVAVFVPSLVLGWLYQYRRSVVVVVSVHALMNGLFLILILLW